MTQDEVDQLRIRAVGKVSAAVRAGQLPRITEETKCVDCGNRATDYEHRDYYRPLDVEPVCKKCNRRRGAAHPVAEDRYENAGTRWNNLNDGEGVEWSFAGRVVVDIDIREIEYELEKARKMPDPDLKIAMVELGKLKNVREYQIQKIDRMCKTVAVGESLYDMEYRRRCPTKKDSSNWKLHSATKYKNLRRQVGEKILLVQP